MALSKIGTSTSNPLGEEYEVFMNFRGCDTRFGFVDTLYTDLIDAGIRVYRDDREIPWGERISDNLLQAIDDSRLYIIIFSQNYASSYWCLYELARMVQNTSNSGEDGNEKIILPIFYNVKSDDVKLRTPLYSNDIMNLEQRMDQGEFSSKVAETWRQALQKVGGMRGLKSLDYRGDGHLSKLVVEEVVKILETRQRIVAKNLVGMEDRRAAINNLLGIDSRDVRLIGICGREGIGKTTLTKITFNQHCPRFGKWCCFLDNVKETPIVKLQEQLLSNISNSGVASDIRNIDQGINRIRGTIRNKEVLIVLDDVDKGDQIRNLVGGISLCPGTRILVTARDKSVLCNTGFEYAIGHYEMEELSYKDALQLFSRHAFGDNSPPAGYNRLSEDIIVRTVDRLPSTLQAVASSLFGTDDKKIPEEMGTNSDAAASAADRERAEAKFRHPKEVRERESSKAARSRDTVHFEKDEDFADAHERAIRQKQEKLDGERLQGEKEEEDREGRRLEEEREREEKEREQSILEKERERREIEREKATREAREREAAEARDRAAMEARQKAKRAAVEQAKAEARELAETAAMLRAQADARERAAAEARDREARGRAAEAQMTAERAPREANERAAMAARARAETAAVMIAERRDWPQREVVVRAQAEFSKIVAAEAKKRGLGREGEGY